jgi:hypothetical protein
MIATARGVWMILGFLALAGVAWGIWPRRADLRGFDPYVVARLETRMWRDYYDHQVLDLFGCLYALNRRQYRFSPYDSARLAFFAAAAARRFQPTRSRAQAQVALRPLEQYYGIIRRRAGETFDSRKAARLELDWWQLRRENAGPAEYGRVVGDCFAEVYRVDNAALRESALLRAEMMDYRDRRRDGTMKEADWRYIETSLVRAYGLLKEAVVRRAAA